MWGLIKKTIFAGIIAWIWGGITGKIIAALIVGGLVLGFFLLIAGLKALFNRKREA